MMKANQKFKLKAPIGDKLIVKVLEVDKVTAGGIIVPDGIRSQHSMAKAEAQIVAIGETANCDLLDEFPEVGDYILITKYAGTLYEEADGVEHRVIEGREMLATLEVCND